MLADLIAREPSVRGSRVLDVCAGSGALALAAARAGARDVTAVDVSRRAVLATRLNAILNGRRVRGLRGSLFAPVSGRFDMIVSNPPYLPGEAELPTRGARRAWEGGARGRLLLDRIVTEAPRHLLPAGVLLLIQSSVCGADATLDRLAGAGLDGEILERRRGPLGPLLAARAEQLEAAGLLGPGEREEELVAIRARRGPG